MASRWFDGAAISGISGALDTKRWLDAIPMVVVDAGSTPPASQRKEIHWIDGASWPGEPGPNNPKYWSDGSPSIGIFSGGVPVVVEIGAALSVAASMLPYVETAVVVPVSALSVPAAMLPCTVSVTVTVDVNVLSVAAAMLPCTVGTQISIVVGMLTVSAAMLPCTVIDAESVVVLVDALSVDASLLPCTVVSVVGGDYYVATNGSDSNPGTSAEPFLTIQRAVDAASAGNVIIVRDGTYGANGVGVDGFPVVIDKSGAPGQYITILAENHLGAVCDGELDCHSYFVFLDSSSYWKISGFQMKEAWWAGIWANCAAHHITVEHNEFHHIGNRYEAAGNGIEGIYAGPDAHDWRIDANLFHHIGRTSGSLPNHDHGIYTHFTDSVIVNNVFHDHVQGWPVQLSQGCDNVLVANNTFAKPNPSREGHIVFDGDCTNITIENNISWEAISCLVAIAGGTFSNILVRNNIVYSSSGPMILVSPPTNGFTGYDNLIDVDPVMLDPANDNYHLDWSSPARDAGVVVDEAPFDYEGTARGSFYDLGAFEILSTTDVIAYVECLTSTASMLPVQSTSVQIWASTLTVRASMLPAKAFGLRPPVPPPGSNWPRPPDALENPFWFEHLACSVWMGYLELEHHMHSEITIFGVTGTAAGTGSVTLVEGPSPAIGMFPLWTDRVSGAWLATAGSNEVKNRAF